MALNKYMHQRNIYKTPPDFEKLSKSHNDFAKIAKMDVTGKITIDFKDPRALRVLTKCLLKSDFNLEVEIPEDRLVPTLPLRLNYILWIEDLITVVQNKPDIRGIDIGTGACAIYPLIAAVKNKWFMLATETDPVSLEKAKENIQKNNLQHLIELRNNTGPKLIENLFNANITDKFDFCMCNPPFYSNLQELYESRSPARHPPKNGFTGSPHELITEGGELTFCRTLIDESKRCKHEVLVFTTMVGHKYTLSELLVDLKAEGIKHTHTEFCQGRVTRWGLAWTYQDYDLYHLVPPREKLRKKNLPILHHLPPIPNCEYNLESSYGKLKTILNGLQIEQKVLNKCGNRISLDILARENTWSNQRRKRRLLKQMETSDAKRSKSELNNIEPNISNMEKLNEENGSNIGVKNEAIVAISLTSQVDDIIISDIKSHQNNQEKDANYKDTIENGSTNVDNIRNNLNDSSLGNTVLNSKSQQATEPLIHAFMKLYKKDDTVQLEIDIIGGIGGKESVYQVIQYIKNNWK